MLQMIDDRRQTEGRWHNSERKDDDIIANVNVSSRSLKNQSWSLFCGSVLGLVIYDLRVGKFISALDGISEQRNILLASYSHIRAEYLQHCSSVLQSAQGPYINLITTYLVCNWGISRTTVLYSAVLHLSLIHIWRCRRSYACRSRWSPYH